MIHSKKTEHLQNSTISDSGDFPFSLGCSCCISCNMRRWSGEVWTHNGPSSTAAGKQQAMPQTSSSLSPHVLHIGLPFEAQRRSTLTPRFLCYTLHSIPVCVCLFVCLCSCSQVVSLHQQTFILETVKVSERATYSYRSNMVWKETWNRLNGPLLITQQFLKDLSWEERTD